MLTSACQESLQQSGFMRWPGFYEPEQATRLIAEVSSFVERYYNETELLKHSVYPSDKTDSRVSHAMMISEGKSQFPKVDHDDYPQIKSFLQSQNQLLSELTGKPVDGGARSLLNYQKYMCGSKPVGEHFDGEYLRADKASDGVEFNLLEGILPRYVGVMVLENENDGRGVEILDKQNGKVYAPILNPGDLVLFDNINLRHRVPTLEKPRISLGLRNFDHMPCHFARNEDFFLKGANYKKIPEGFVSEDADCESRMHRYMEEEWPLIKDEYTHYV